MANPYLLTWDGSGGARVEAGAVVLPCHVHFLQRGLRLGNSLPGAKEQHVN